MQIRHFVFNPLMENTYVLYEADQHVCVVIDPGCVGEKECSRLGDFIDRNDLRLLGVLCTHLHFDHQMGNRYLHDRYHVEPMAMKADLFLAQEARQMASMFAGIEDGVMGYDVTRFIQDEQQITLGPFRFSVLATPGHTPGGCCFYMPDEQIVFTGDTLFQGSVGRADFEYSSYADLIDGIQSRLLSLPDDTYVLPGHGPATTIGFERLNNPFL
ncbi:MAG: MBL fold metallo-hydrolase [Paludibacteraceae bacterium]|nr:MBL fold metallo-hydrolase [Paludibacteraceae bacterium]